MNTLGERLKFARKACGLTQADVADHFEIARVSVTNWESGKTKPEIERIPALAALFGTTVEWLLEEKGPAPIKQDKKAAPSIAGDEITSARQRLLDIFDSLDPVDRPDLVNFVEKYVKGPQRTPKPRPSPDDPVRKRPE